MVLDVAPIETQQNQLFLKPSMACKKKSQFGVHALASFDHDYDYHLLRLLLPRLMCSNIILITVAAIAPLIVWTHRDTLPSLPRWWRGMFAPLLLPQPRLLLVLVGMLSQMTKSITRYIHTLVCMHMHNAIICAPLFVCMKHRNVHDAWCQMSAHCHCLFVA